MPADEKSNFHHSSSELAALILCLCHAISCILDFYLCVCLCVSHPGASHPRVPLSGNGCGTTCVGVGGGRPRGLSADGGVVVAFVSLLFPHGLQIDILFLWPCAVAG